MLVVLGTTGKTGRRLCAKLLEAGEQVLALGLDEARLGALDTLGARTASVDVEDLHGLREAFSGAAAVYLMSPTGPRVEDVFEAHRRMGEALADAVRAARVSHAVLMSACGVHRQQDNPLSGMQAIEAALRAVPGLDLAMLRPAFFMENFYAWFDEAHDRRTTSNVIEPTRRIP